MFLVKKVVVLLVVSSFFFSVETGVLFMKRCLL